MTMNSSELVAMLGCLRKLIEDKPSEGYVLNTYNEDYLKQMVHIALEYERFKALEILLVHFGVPEHLTLKEKIAYYQLLGNDE